jgi:hypothetical protein
MTTRWMRAAVVALAFVAGARGESAVHAQVVVTSEQDLHFGLLTPGVASTVVPTDVARRAALVLEGRGRFAVSFQLPTHLVALDGTRMPILFGSQSGWLDIRNRVNSSFDPNTVLNVHLNPVDRVADIFLGGTAQPAPAQPAGSYRATIVLMVVQTGS